MFIFLARGKFRCGDTLTGSLCKIDLEVVVMYENLDIGYESKGIRRLHVSMLLRACQCYMGIKSIIMEVTSRVFLLLGVSDYTG